MDTAIETTTFHDSRPTHPSKPIGLRILSDGMDAGYRRMYAADDAGDHDLAIEMSKAIDHVWELYGFRYNEWQARGGQSYDRMFEFDPGPLECTCRPIDWEACPACKVQAAMDDKDELEF